MTEPEVRQTLAIDFDGPIHRYSRGWHDGTIYDEPTNGAIATLSIMRLRYNTVIFSTRNSNDIVDWLIDHNVYQVFPCYNQPWDGYPFWNDPQLILVTNLKPAAVAYIDDRAIRYKTWGQSYEDLRHYTERKPKKNG